MLNKFAGFMRAKKNNKYIRCEITAKASIMPCVFVLIWWSTDIFGVKHCKEQMLYGHCQKQQTGRASF